MKKKFAVMTNFAVPYDVVKKFLLKNAVEFIESSKEQIEADIDKNLREKLGENYYIIKLAEKKGWEPIKMAKYIENLTKFSPIAATMVLLREIAIDFDNRHEGHIEESEEIWTISMLNGKVEKVDKAHVKNYRNFPAFRSKKEAKEAHAILSKRVRNMFRGCGKK